MKLNKLIVIPIFAAVLCLSLTHNVAKVNAATVTVDVSVNVSPSCVGNVDGSAGSTYTDVPPGSDVTISVYNTDSVVSQSITGNGIAGGSEVGTDSKTGTNDPTTVSLNSVTSPVTVVFTPIPNNNNGVVSPNYCPMNSNPTSSSIVINPASATLSCSLQGSEWDLTGNFDGSSTGTGIFNGSTEVASISPGSINQNVAASTTAETFTVLDGTNYVGKGTSLASAPCTAYSPSAATSSVTSPPKTTTTATGTTTVPVTSPTTTPPASSPHSSVAATTTVSNTTLPATKNIKSRNTSLLEKTSYALLGLVVILAILVFAGLWTAPKKLIANVWHKIVKQKKL